MNINNYIREDDRNHVSMTGIIKENIFHLIFG